MTTSEHQSNGQKNSPKITLYTNHGCPWAHRAHITLKELDLPYEEIIIDLDKPREPWYLEVNPRGLVPSLKYSDGSLHDEIITESAVVSQFLADSRPSHLLPASSDSPTAPLVRARIAFFVDTYISKVGMGSLFPIMRLDSLEEKEARCAEYVATVEKEIEPLLKDAAPFFGGSKELTFAETQVAPFVLRLYAFSNDELLPASLKKSLDALPNFSKWAKATLAKESVTFIVDEEQLVRRTTARMQKMKAQAQSK